MSQVSATGDVDLAQYGEILRRRAWIPVVMVVLGAALAVAAIAFLPKTYTASASVLVSPTGDETSVEGGRTSGTVNLDTEAQLVTSSVVAERAASILDSSLMPSELTRTVNVTVPPNTSVLEISFAADSPEAARDGAAAFAESYLSNRLPLAEGRADRTREFLEAERAKLQRQVSALDGQIASTVAPARRQLLTDQRADALVQIGAYTSELAQLTRLELRAGDVITPASIPQAPSDPNRPILIASGLLVGLLGGIGLAFLVDRRDTRVRDRRDLERVGLDALVPHLVVPVSGEIAAPHSTRFDQESMRKLRNAILAQMPGHRGSIMVAAASCGDIGSSVGLNLAATLARSDLDVIYVAAGSPVEGSSGGTDGRGLAEVLQDRAVSEEVLLEDAHVPGLRIMQSGKDGSLYSGLLQSERTGEVFAGLSELTDLVVIDVAPVAENADAQTLAGQLGDVGGVVLVAEHRKTTRADLLEAVDQFQHVRGRVLGAVVARQAKTGASTTVVSTPLDTPTSTRLAAEPDDGHQGLDETPVESDADDKESNSDTAPDAELGADTEPMTDTRVNSGATRKPGPVTKSEQRRLRRYERRSASGRPSATNGTRGPRAQDASSLRRDAD